MRPLDAGMGNVHYLEYVHTFILEYFPSEYYRKHISLIICFITAFVNLGVLLSRGNSNIFQGPNLPEKNHKGPDSTHQGPNLPAQGSNLPGPHLPQEITRGLICREPPEEGCSKFIKILQS